MSDWDALDEFLRTDPNDVGCDRALSALHTYAELAAAGANPAEMFPGIMVHLRACSACSTDYEALQRAMREFEDDEPL